MTIIRSIFSILLLTWQVTLIFAQGDIRPDQILFRRQAVVRMVFDSSQNIPLSSLKPAMVHDFELMHPEKLPNTGVQWKSFNGQLTASAPGAEASSLRWVGGFNPFATYDLVIETSDGSGSVGLAFVNATREDSLVAALRFKDGKPEAVTWSMRINGQVVMEEEWAVPSGISNSRLTLRAQMSAVGVNLFVESNGRSHMVGYSDFAQHLDLRERTRIQQMDFALQADLKANAQVTFAGASAHFSPGIGQADIRAITDEEGSPLLEDGRLWCTMTLRGRALPASGKATSGTTGIHVWRDQSRWTAQAP